LAHEILELGSTMHFTHILLTYLCFNSMHQTSAIPKAGILGGGQLGRMLLQAAANYPVETFVMENDDACPAAHLCHHFTKGDIRDFDSVYRFGKNLNALTIEIENVNVDALEKLETEGVKIVPRPSVLKIIKDKILQKQYYRQHHIPTADFIITQNLTELKKHKDFLPAVHKLARGGYDGRGVQVVKTPEQFENGFDAPAVLEKLVAIEKEIAILVAVNETGETVTFPPVQMHFDPQLNLLDYQICPASLNNSLEQKATEAALAVVKNFHSPGIFAVEMFVTHAGEVLVNETAPRVHNSGHHSIEALHCSQFDMLWRILLGYSPGNTELILPSVMINLIGANGYSGRAVYRGLDEVLKMKNTYVHIYGKKETRPGRKMGHVTVLGHDRNELIDKAEKIKTVLQVISA
jgi:5-(carboxyamino)imidazole ribonucleotide synthase